MEGEVVMEGEVFLKIPVGHNAITLGELVGALEYIAETYNDHISDELVAGAFALVADKIRRGE